MMSDDMLPELQGDPRRQAVSSIRGIIYQAWCSIDAWLRLDTADQVIYLEGAEDFDQIKEDGATAVQVRQTEAAVSLGTAKARDALEQFWALASKEPSRQVDYHYITTSAVAKESDGTFESLPGIEAWRVARTSSEMALSIAQYLKAKLPADSALRQFVAHATSAELQDRLFRRFHWFTDQPGIEEVQQSVEDRICVLLHKANRSVSLAPQVRMQLESRLWQTIQQRNSAQRSLTLGNLVREIESATTANIPIPIDQLPDLLIGSTPGQRMLKLLVEEVPAPPATLIQRSDLVHRVAEAVNQRSHVLLTGTVFKGKSTLAQLVANTRCPGAWWIGLTERKTDEVVNTFKGLADAIESQDCPSLVVIDDLDISPTAHRAYKTSLGLVLHRARAAGKAVLLTAQGGSSETALLSEFKGIEIIDVPELAQDEVTNLCIQEGCTGRDARAWGPMVHAFSRGHPKLVQVRIDELATSGWPSPNASNIIAESPAADTVRQIARRLLSDTLPAEVAEFLYCASESSVPLHRSVALKLAEKFCGIRNPGDILDRLSGRWLEHIGNDWYRTTSLLQGAAREVWSPTRRATAHVQLHDSILSKGTLDPAEAAALLFHAYLGKEPRRISNAALKLQVIEDRNAQEAVERNLLWMPYVALGPGEQPCDEPVASAAFRSLQFRVAVTLDSDRLPEICLRWAESVALIQHEQIRQAMQLTMWGSIPPSNSAKLPIKMRLDAIRELRSLKLTGEIAIVAVVGMKAFFKRNNPEDGVPNEATTTQVLLALCVRWSRDAATLHDIVEWLDLHATDEIRAEFDSILEWRLVQNGGAFVQTAWAAEHEKVTDWEPWLVLFDYVEDYALRRRSPVLGREAAKAKATILTEYCEQAPEALEALSEAEKSFGASVVLDEQRANILFQTNADAAMLEVWGRIVANSSTKATLDPFAFRRAAICAVRLKKWDVAERIFRGAIDSIRPGHFVWTRFGLLVDCALAISLGGDQRRAAECLAEAVVALPESASDEGDERWEASQRAAIEVSRRIQNAIWKPTDAVPKFQPGYASSPSLSVAKCEAGQAWRVSVLRGDVMKLCACLGVAGSLDATSEIVALRSSQDSTVRWLIAKALLARSFELGAAADFMPTLVAFDAATTEQLRAKGGDVAEVRPGQTNVGEYSNRWFGLLIAGAACAGKGLQANLAAWLGYCGQAPQLTNVTATISEILEGASLPPHLLRRAVADESISSALRCGAAASLLVGPLTPNETFTMQGFVVSALVSDASTAFQEVCNRHLAVRFAEMWERHAQNPFNLPSPGTTVPALMAAVKNVREGSGTLKSLFLDVAAALGYVPSAFVKRVS